MICPENAVCLGKDSLVPEKGYWHSHRYSTQVHRCPNQAACDRSQVQGHENVIYQGSSIAIDSGDMDWQCSTACHGNLCGNCMPEYGATKPFTCGRCMSQALTLGLFVLSLLCVICVLVYMSHATYTLRTYVSNEQAGTALKGSDIMKVFVLYVQYTVIISSTNVQWPGAVTTLFAAMGFIFSSGTGQVLSLDCLYNMAMPTGYYTPVAIVRQLTYLALPFMVMFVVAVLHACWWWLRQAANSCHRGLRPMQRLPARRQLFAVSPRPFASWMIARLPLVFMVVLFFFYPSLVQVSWS